MKTKTKKKPLISYDEAQTAAASYTMMEALLKKKEAAIAEAVAKVEARHAADIKEAKEAKAEAELLLADYAAQERSNWEGKSTQIGKVTIGFRGGAWSVQLGKNETAQTVVAKLKDAGLKRYLRVKEDIDKTALLKVTDEATLGTLSECGVGFAQSETFYIEVK